MQSDISTVDVHPDPYGDDLVRRTTGRNGPARERNKSKGPVTRSDLKLGPASQGPFFRLNLNIINRCLPQVRAQGINRDFLWNFIYSCLHGWQRTKSPELVFESWYGVLDWLGWDKGSRRYDQLEECFDLWPGVVVTRDEEWYRKPKIKAPRGIMSRRGFAEYRARRTQAGKEYARLLPETFHVCTVVRRKRDDRLIIRADPDFIDVNRDTTAKVDLNVARRLRYPKDQLYLLLCAFRYGELRISLDRLFDKVGKTLRLSPSENKEWLLDAVDEIKWLTCDARVVSIKPRRKQQPLVCIKRPRIAQQRADDQHVPQWLQSA